MPTARIRIVVLASLVSLALLLASAGCLGWPFPREAPRPTSGSPATTGNGAETARETTSPQSEPATLFLRIRWPERDRPGFRAATIPTSTRTLRVQVWKGSSSLATELIRRGGTAEATASLRVEPAQNVSIEVEAFRDAEPPQGGGTLIARGSAAGLNLAPARLTPVNISLDALFVPSVDSLSANLGSAGNSVRLLGRNLGAVEGQSPEVYFNGARASEVTQIDAGTLDVVVPQSALTGPIHVVNDGVSSANSSNTVFWAFRGLGIQAPRQGWDTGPGDDRQVLYEASLILSAAPVWLFKPGEGEADYGLAPEVEISWSNSNPQAGTLSGNGVFVATASAASTTIAARSGPLTSPPMAVKVVGVDGVSLGASAMSINAAPPSGPPDPGYVTYRTLSATVRTSLSFNGGVTWHSSDPSRVSVATASTISTVVSARPSAAEGTVLVTATTVDFPQRTATAAVNVTAIGGITAEVR